MLKLKSQLRFENSLNTAKVKTDAGEWRFQQFKANIIKVSFHPNNYHRNEYLSDAVISKPMIIPAHSKRDSAIGIFDYTITDKELLLEGPVHLQINFFHGAYDYNGFQFRLDELERIYGGGSRAVSLNRRGHGFPLYNEPRYSYSENTEGLNYSVPFITSSKGYALLFDNASRGYLDIGKKHHDILEYAAVSGELNFFLITGTPQTILRSYHELTGTQPLPPRWVMGNFMSRFGYTSQQQVEEIADEMRKQDIPFDAVIFDLFWFGDSIQYTMGNLDWVNKEKWPDPKSMIDALKEDNVQSILITEPYVLRSSSNFNIAESFLALKRDGEPYPLQDFYFGEGGLIDIFKTTAQEWFWSKYKKQMRLGVEGWWGDLGEPEKHPADMFHDLTDLGLKRFFSADEIHNLFGHTWTKFLYERFAKDFPSKRLFSLNRSGFAGTQRYSIFPWSGDVERSWSGYRAQLPVMLGMAMSGVPYMHSDAGGFAGGNGDNELYVRWLQFAVFSPILRPHGTALYDVDENTFNFPSEPALIDEPYRSIVRNYIYLRYQLLPYNYTLAYKQTVLGEPLVKPLYYAFPSDEKCTFIEDTYMWGDYFLIAPILHKHETERRLYLPRGEWYRLGETEKIKGGQKLIERISLDQMPVFVKAGSIIPMAERKKIKTTVDCLNDAITWHYYPSTQTSSFDLYDDDGKTKDADKKELYDIIHIAVIPDETGYQVKLTSKGGRYKEKPAVRKMHLVVHADTIGVVKEAKVPVRKTSYNAGKMYSFNFDFTDQPVHFKILK
jgi:oligosaccharide 4-alpha-D-glucosyltransferase